MSYYPSNSNDYSTVQQHQRQLSFPNSNHPSASSSSNSSPLERSESNPGIDSNIHAMENRNSNLGFLEDFVHNNNYQGSSAQNMNQYYSNVASSNDYLSTNSNSRENRRTTYQQLPNLALSGASDGTALYADLNNAFDWNNGSGYTRASGAGQQAQSNHQWQLHSSTSSFNPNEFSSSRSDGWPNNYHRSQMDQSQNWETNPNQSSLISSQAQAEVEALMDQAEEISNKFKPSSAKTSTKPQGSSIKVESSKNVFKPAASEHPSTNSAAVPAAAPTTRKARVSRSSKSANSQTVKQEESVEEPTPAETSQKAAITSKRKRKFAPAPAPPAPAPETETEDSPGGSFGRSRYPCLHAGCGKTFSTSGHRARHHRIHTGIKPYRCTFPECGACFSRQDNGLQHFRTHKASSKTAEQDDDRLDGGMSDSFRTQMVDNALQQGTAIEVVKGNQESRVERKSQSTVTPMKSTSSSRSKKNAPSTKSAKATSTNNATNSRASKRVKMEKTPSLDPSTDSTASESSSSYGPRPVHTRNTRRSAKPKEVEAELPMLSVSLSSPSFSNPSPNDYSSSNGSSLSGGSSISASTSATTPGSLNSSASQQQELRDKQVKYSDSMRQQMMMMPIYGKDSTAPPPSIDGHHGAGGKASAYEGMTPGTQDIARQTSFGDAFRGAFPQVATPDLAPPM